MTYKITETTKQYVYTHEFITSGKVCSLVAPTYFQQIRPNL